MFGVILSHKVMVRDIEVVSVFGIGIDAFLGEDHQGTTHSQVFFFGDQPDVRR